MNAPINVRYAIMPFAEIYFCLRKKIASQNCNLEFVIGNLELNRVVITHYSFRITHYAFRIEKNPAECSTGKFFY